MRKAALRNWLSLAAGIALLSGCATQQPTEQSPEGPPPPRIEVVPPQTNATLVWTQGYWDWRGRWVWTPGHWGPSPHSGAVWVEGRWVRHGRREVWVRPHWQ